MDSGRHSVHLMKLKILQNKWARLPGNLRGAAWMLVAMLALAGMTVMIKLLGRSMSVWEVLVLRAAFALVILSPALIRAGPRVFHTQRPWLHLSRSSFGFVGIVALFFALQHLDLALVTTLGFARILFMIVCAVLFLGETIRWRRSLATVMGFVGVVICMRPGADGFDPWTLAALASALLGAGVTTTIKRLTATETPLTITSYAYVIMGVIAFVPALFDWRAPSTEQLLMVVAMAAFSAAGQTCVAYALRAGDVTAVTPFEYSRMLWALALGYFLFAEVPSGSTWWGGAIIIASTLYIGLREARLSREKNAARRA
ncbi:MAG: drug/metabolite transporter (DMT)-like permease [Gammaproteobacteria bacterium]|jgi:drug/metabolite transporter (DMT)-like permease